MATLANHPTGFDFPLYADFSASSYPSDPLNAFLEQSDSGDNAAAADGASHRSDMAFNDPNSFQQFFAQQQPDQQQLHQPHQQQPSAPTGSRPIDIAGAVYQSGLAPPIPNPFGQLPPAATSSSETVGSMRSSSSSLSPSLHGFQQQGPPVGYVASASSTDLSSCNTSNFDPDSFNPNDYQSLLAGDKTFGYVDPSLLQPMAPTPPLGPTQTFQPGSPALSHSSSVGPQRQRGSSRTSSPYLQSQGAWAPYPVPSPQRSASADVEDSRERERSNCPECGKPFRDMKAHMLTHQTERPEKCPIPTCEYHKKGFSRKYDKNRHTLTHYKGTMVCGFCPHSGSAAEKTFNRADVFKRHLTTVHGVEQNPPNSRKKPPTAAQGFGSDAHGKCSICNRVFSTPQDFYDHLEDCVLNVVQKVDPSEAINERLLTSVADDEDVKNSLERSNLPTSLDATTTAEFGSGDEDDDEDDEGEELYSKDPRSGRGNIRSKKDEASHGQSRNVLSQVGSGAITKPSSGGGSSGRGARGAGMTYSKGGVALLKQGRKRRKNYPVSWGCSPDKMKMKKRVLTCWDGQRRLVKDDMMLGNEFEVRMALPDAGENAWVTDLDVQTLRRADAFHGSTEEERGPWDQYLTNVPDGSVEGLMAS